MFLNMDDRRKRRRRKSYKDRKKVLSRTIVGIGRRIVEGGEGEK